MASDLTLVIDNYDSFTYNLVQYLGELGAKIHVARNDRITVAEARALQPARIVISPGPCTPDEAGVSLDIVREFGPDVPLLGVCLGHQSVGQAFGGRVVRCGTVMHGKTSSIRHDGRGLFRGVPSPFTATRYHSLIVERQTLPDELEIAAETDDGTIMAVRHRRYPVTGVQFHPESILTAAGKDLLRNFLTSGGAAA